MKIFKRIAAAALVGVMALTALVGCSQSSSSQSTIEGTVTIKNGDTVSTGTMLMVSDGTTSYSKYVIDGTVMESIFDASASYERTYAEGETDAKWTKAAPVTETDTSNAKNGTMTIDGTELQTVTYDDVTYYCFSGNSLQYVYMNDADGETTIKITSITATADTSLLQIPSADAIA